MPNKRFWKSWGGTAKRPHDDEEQRSKKKLGWNMGRMINDVDGEWPKETKTGQRGRGQLEVCQRHINLETPPT